MPTLLYIIVITPAAVPWLRSWWQVFEREGILVSASRGLWLTAPGARSHGRNIFFAMGVAVCTTPPILPAAHVVSGGSFAAARVRELEGETRQLKVSLLAREEDILASDREMHALSTRLRGEVRESGEAAARANAVAAELRRALAATGAGADADGKSGGARGGVDR